MRHTTVISALGLALVASSAQARPVFNWMFPIDGSQEVGPVATPASGFGDVTYDSGSGMLSWTITYSGLIGSISAAHFHGAAPVGVNAGVQVGIGALPSPMIGSAPITALQAADLIAGLWYVNIHSSANPGGEIRGQVVPTPGALALLGLGGIAAIRRRR